MNEPRNLHLAFDVGHSSIGWAVLKAEDTAPALLGCGSVIFPADDCLASTRRGFRRQRRHIRATRLRIARMKTLLAHLGILTAEQLDAVTSSSPWLLAARVLRGGKNLTWPELWDVLRWYAHNRGYDGNKAWSRQEASGANAEDTEKEQKAHELLDAFRAKHGREGTMAEVFCDRLGLDPLGKNQSSTVRFRDLGAAFPREIVFSEVDHILVRHCDERDCGGGLAGCSIDLLQALLLDWQIAKGAGIQLPARYDGGLLFGQLIPRFDNRIIATCPVQFQREYDRVFADTGDAATATHEAAKRAKVPGVRCREFYRFRWAMQLANVVIETGDARKTRRLSKDERLAINAEMEKLGSFTIGDFKKAVRALTGTKRDNLDRLLALPDADKSLILDPARKLATGGLLGVLWPLLDETVQKHTLTDLRRGKSITVRELLEEAPEAEPAFDHWWDGEALKTPRATKRNPNPTPRTRDSVLDEPHWLDPVNGRAAHSREVMDDVWKFVLSGDGHPMDPGAPLFRSEAIRRAQLERAIDEQTNNHLVRHRLKLLERLHADLLKEYAAGEKARIGRITIEVNRDLKEMSGKSAQEQAKEQGQQTFHFRSVEKKLTAAYEGLGVRLGPGLIRKGRIAEDLGWKCPYTGAGFDELDLLHRRVDKDHIIPRSQRASDSLDSLVITLAEINKWKGNRTAVQFVAEEEGKPVPGRPNVMVKTLTHFLKDVDALDTFKGHDDDQRRKKNRQRMLKLRDYVEKEFTPGDLTKTSQLVRLGAEALQRAYLPGRAGVPPAGSGVSPASTTPRGPVIISLPGSVTAAARKSWNLAGCLAAANPNVLNPEDPDENGKPRVHRKTELRGITHLHHALDATVIALTSLLLPCDGGVWKKEAIELLAKRRCNPTEQAQLRALLRGNVTFSAEGQPTLGELPEALREQLRTRLAERRVVQHLPAGMGDMVSDQTVWRLFDPADPHPSAKRLRRWLTAAEVEIPKPDGKTVLIITRKRKAPPKPGEEAKAKKGKFHEGKTWEWYYQEAAKDALLGFAPAGDPAASKLHPYKAVKVLGDNFGIALDPSPTLIRPLHVWRQLQALKAANGGKWPRVIRLGMLVRVLRAKTEKVDYRGVWMVRGVQVNQAKGYLLDLSPPDQIRYRGEEGCFRDVSLETLRKCGIEVLRSPLSGIAAPTPGLFS